MRLHGSRNRHFEPTPGLKEPSGDPNEIWSFGEDIIFAPIVERGQTVKTVYIPGGEWILTKDKKLYTKGTYEIRAELDEFIAFVRKGSDVIKCFE